MKKTKTKAKKTSESVLYFNKNSRVNEKLKKMQLNNDLVNNFFWEYESSHQGVLFFFKKVSSFFFLKKKQRGSKDEYKKMASPSPTATPTQGFLEVDNAFDYKSQFSPSNLTTTYSAVYGGFLLSLFCYVYYLKRKYGIRENIFLMLWSMEEVIEVGIHHVLDTASDVGVLLQFYEGMVTENFYKGETPTEKHNKDIGVSITLFFIASMIAFWGYRVKAGFEIYRVTKSKIRAVLQVIFDWELFRILWINLKLGQFECIGLVKWFRGEEGIFESGMCANAG
ncbi:hypothetical protein RFI_14214 [Reticulomyxa filosa]|uniref:Uncharacterized protein n=1 Tax=Reticulomyxa filosa TaxID=46433 RepID=X6NAP7_RETFI|nr:hypothetical protein RFI_14214 [Reticulomyxa filosa]|eukprot:ETO22973.1 hypothetical protein RFI_14214 [Reticulomyxa filosa]